MNFPMSMFQGKGKARKYPVQNPETWNWRSQLPFGRKDLAQAGSEREQEAKKQAREENSPTVSLKEREGVRLTPKQPEVPPGQEKRATSNPEPGRRSVHEWASIFKESPRSANASVEPPKSLKRERERERERYWQEDSC